MTPLQSKSKRFLYTTVGAECLQRHVSTPALQFTIAVDVRHRRSEGRRRVSFFCLRPSPPGLVMIPACCVRRTPVLHIPRLQNMCRISYSACVGGRHPLCHGQSVLAAILAFRCKTSVAICVWSRRRCQSSAGRRCLSSAGRW